MNQGVLKMAEVLKERSEMADEFKWDLTPMYASDEEWEKDLAKLDEMAAAAAAYSGKLTDAKTIREYFDMETASERVVANVVSYAMLRRCEDTREAAAQSMYARAYGKMVTLSAAASFAEPEILSLPEEQLKEIAADPVLADYAFRMEQLLKRKPHTLSTAEEKLLASLGEALGASKEIANNLEDADLVFDPVKDGNGEEKELSGSNYILLQSSTDRVLRENAFHSYYKSFKQHINTFAAAYNGAVKGATATAQARHYASSREMVMSGSNIPVPVYDNLIEAVRRHMPAMYRYVRLRKKLLQVPELHYYDVYAPLSGEVENHYTYEEAQKMVLDAVAPMGSTYTDVVKGAFKSRWIDVYPNKGKRGGAFSSGTYDSNPYILTNFTGTLDSVSTIAHEMGHSMHTWFSKNNQPPQYADYTLFVAEVASTVNENLLIEQLLSKENDPKRRLALLNQYLEGFKGTVYRQTMFAEFEKEAHAMAERGEALNPAALNGLYKKLVEDYFGPDMVLDEEVQYEWARIPHFYRPFYVYVYATGYSTAVALSEGILKEGAPAVKRYLEFLSMGGSKVPLEELAHAGVDLNTPEPIDRALTKFEQVLDDAERTADLVLAGK